MRSFSFSVSFLEKIFCLVTNVIIKRVKPTFVKSPSLQVVCLEQSREPPLLLTISKRLQAQGKWRFDEDHKDKRLTTTTMTRVWRRRRWQKFDNDADDNQARFIRFRAYPRDAVLRHEDDRRDAEQRRSTRRRHPRDLKSFEEFRRDRTQGRFLAIWREEWS